MTINGVPAGRSKTATRYGDTPNLLFTNGALPDAMMYYEVLSEVADIVDVTPSLLLSCPTGKNLINPLLKISVADFVAIGRSLLEITPRLRREKTN